MAKENQTDTSEPHRVEVRRLPTVKTCNHGHQVMDEADGAMFSRIPSNLDSVIRGQNSRISDVIASPGNHVIVPVSVKSLTAKPNLTVPKDGLDIGPSFYRDMVDTSETNVQNDHDKNALLHPDYISDGCFDYHTDSANCERCQDDNKRVTSNKRNVSKSHSPKHDIEDHRGGIIDTVVVQDEGQTTCTPLQIDDHKDKEDVSPFLAKHFLSLLFPFAAIVVFLADIGTDMQLAVSYKRKGETDLFYATVACIIIPSIIMAAVDLSWMWVDRGRFKGGKCLLAGRIILGLLSFGRIVRAVSHMYHIVRKKTGPSKSWHRHRALDEKRDCYMLDFINAFAESCPQLFVQMYLLYKYDLPLELIRVVSLLTSWISIAWTYASYYRCAREASTRSQDMNLFGFLLFFISVLAGLAPRVICVVLFLVYFELWIGVLLLTSHYLLMLIWIVYQKPKLEGTTASSFGRFMYSLLFAYVSMMCFMNLQNNSARLRMIIFYVIIYVENCVMSGLITWQMFTDGRGNSEKPLNFISLPIGFVVHVTFLSLYYECMHPTTGRRYKSNTLPM